MSPTRKPTRKRAAISSQAAGQTRSDALSPAPHPDPQRPAEQVGERDVLQWDRDADFRPVEEEVGDAEAEQDEQVEVGDTPEAPPVDQAEQEDRAEGQEDVGGVELVPERSRVAAGHFPGHLVPGPGLTHGAGLRIDDDERHLFVAGEVADLPVAVDLVGAVGQHRVLFALLDHVRVGGGDLGGLRGVYLCRGRCREEREREEEEQDEGCWPAGPVMGQGGLRAGHGPSSTPLPHATRGRSRVLHHLSPKCSRTTGATSRRVHCLRAAASAGPQPTNRSGPRESPACSEPWLPPPAWVTPPQSTAS